jgi:hypothetical protein
MKAKYTISILLAATALLVVSGCIAQEKDNSISIMKYLPQGKDLPEGFKLMKIENSELNDPNKNIFKANMTDEIIEFLLPTPIGPTNTTTANYLWGTPGVDYDAKITIISLKDEEHAKAAVSNYLSYRKSNYLVKLGNESLINPTRINDHDATEIGEIKDTLNGRSIQLIYLWNSRNLVVLAEGNDNRTVSMKFASATGV